MAGADGLAIAGLAASIGVGLIFAAAGIGKLRHAALMDGVVANYRLLPPALVVPVARILPYAELAIAAGLLSGIRPWPQWVAAAPNSGGREADIHEGSVSADTRSRHVRRQRSTADTQTGGGTTHRTQVPSQPPQRREESGGRRADTDALFGSALADARPSLKRRRCSRAPAYAALRRRLAQTRARTPTE